MKPKNNKKTKDSTSSNSRVRIVHVSDIHLFHARNPTKEILDKLRLQLFQQDADLVLFGGDIFDNLATLSVDSIWDVFAFAKDLIKWAEETRTLIRILKGTPRHDWKQNRIFASTALSMGSELLVCKDDLEIEHIAELGIDILYIPDEYRPTTAETWQAVEVLLKNTGLSQVDVVCMHGAFDYQLSDMVSEQYLHKSEQFESITRYFVTVGHIHQYSRHSKIIAQGSYDRLCHGDEGAKGLSLTVIDKSKPGDFETTFIENTGAMVFKTVDVSQLNLDDGILAIKAVADTLVPGSHLRVEASVDSKIYQGYKTMISEYPWIHWSRKASDKSKKKTQLQNMLHTYNSIVLTKDNIVSLTVEKAMSSADDWVERELLESLIQPLVPSH